MKIVSLILARGGSKGIPNKNIINIKGQPLLAYTIQASIASNVSETWVSTEDYRIKNVALSFGANVIDRPPELASDTSKSEDAIIHFVKNIDFDLLVFIQPTSPLIKHGDINLGIDMMNSGAYDSVFTVSVEHWLPRWTRKMTPIDWDPNNRPRRQDVEECLVENGAFYITTKKALLTSGLRYSGRLGYIEIPLSRSFQIDTPEDLDLIKKII